MKYNLESKQEDDIELPPLEMSELYQKIYNNIINYNNTEELSNELNKMKTKNDNSIDEFRKILLDFTENLVHISDNMTLRNFKTDILKAINLYPKKIIDTFIIHGYMKDNGMYRRGIVEGNEYFFMNKSYNEYTNGDSDIINYIFQFKSFWSKLSEDNKFIIKTFLLTLCYYSDQRFIIFNRYQEIKKKNKERFENIFLRYDLLL